jgi:Fe-S oxidoreductase
MAVTDALFWYGCNMTRHGEIIRLASRMLEAVGVGAAPVGGPGACCGSVKESTPRIAEGMANRTMEKFGEWASGVRSAEGGAAAGGEHRSRESAEGNGVRSAEGGAAAGGEHRSRESAEGNGVRSAEGGAAAGGEHRSRESAAAPQAQPRVITWCPSCHMNLDDFMGQTKEQGFDSRHLCEALWERRDALAPLLTRPVRARFLVDRHVGFHAEVPVNDIIPGLLSLIPGAEHVDHAYRGGSYMCFGLANVPGALPDHQRALLAAMRETGADTLITIFHSCHRELVGLERDHGIRVVNWVHLLAEAMGWDHTDDYKAWRNAEDPLAAIGPERLAAAGEVAVKKLVLPELTRPRPV